MPVNINFTRLFLFRVLVAIALVSTLGVLAGTGSSVITPLVIAIVIVPWLVSLSVRENDTTKTAIVRFLSMWIPILTMLILWFTFMLYATHGSWASATPWILRVRYTPAGKCSCTRNTLVTEPYNPNGVDSIDIQVTRVYSFCVFPEMQWADNNGLIPNKTSDELLLNPTYTPCTESCTVASRFPEDYPNPGRGLTHGWDRDASVHDTTLCPGVKAEINDAGILGKGTRQCSTCTHAFADLGLIPAQPECPVQDSAFCALCPGPYGIEGWQTTQVRLVAWMVLPWFFLVFIVTGIKWWNEKHGVRILLMGIVMLVNVGVFAIWQVNYAVSGSVILLFLVTLGAFLYDARNKYKYEEVKEENSENA